MSKTDTGLQFVGDPYWGKGGRYVVDLQSGARVPAGQATAQPSADAPLEPEPAETAAPQEQTSQQSKEN